MNRNTNLPPGRSASDLDGPRDMAAAMDAFFERLDRREQERREQRDQRVKFTVRDSTSPPYNESKLK